MNEIISEIILDHERAKRYNMFEVAEFLNVTVELIESICYTYHLGKVNEDGIISFTKGSKDSDDDISLLRFYIEHPSIEKEVIEAIYEMQPTTVYKLSLALNISRERIWKVLDEITLVDSDLIEDTVGKRDYLFYGDKGRKLLEECEEA